jgi:circadian clock protein KaiC
VRELLLSEEGVSLADVYSVGGEVLVGTARWEREQEEIEIERTRASEARRKRARLEIAEAEVTGRLVALQRELESQRAELAEVERDESARRSHRASNIAGVLHRRRGDREDNAHDTTVAESARQG